MPARQIIETKIGLIQLTQFSKRSKIQEHSINLKDFENRWATVEFEITHQERIFLCYDLIT